EGTHLIADINPDAGNSNPYGFTVIDRSLYFSAEDGKTGDELWRADIDRLPVATDMEATTAFETAYSGTLSATDGDSDPLTFAIVNQPEHGKVKLSDATKGTFTYTPDDGFSGADSFTFTANDGYDTSAPGTVELTVQDEPTPPSDNGGDNAGGSQGQAPASSGGGGAFGFLAGLLLMGLALRRRHP
ncbi:MAG TPA: Ig-like domain-containing protein, partial [Gammaproteobacteria bacterium]|nr:Ig-like domain-containing protein [Gammaproteobacteria bacterium]